MMVDAAQSTQFAARVEGFGGSSTPAFVQERNGPTARPAA